MDELTFYDGAYSGVQVDAAIARALAGGAIDQEIASLRAAVGSPLMANTIAEMTNTNRIYVYTGSEAGYNSGHWYYWNGSAWTDGGAYNSAAADDEMSDSSTNAVQNKVIKTYVDAVKTDLDSTTAKAKSAMDAALGAYPTETASGAIASTEIGADGVPLKALTVQIAPVQAPGTPTPETPLPISGWSAARVFASGKNLFDRANAITGYILEDGTENTDPVGQHSPLIPIKPGESVCVSGYYSSPQTIRIRLHGYDSSGSWVQQIAVTEVTSAGWWTVVATIPANVAYVAISFARVNTNVMLEYGAARTEYAPFVSLDTQTISLGQTVYGGTITYLGNKLWQLLPTKSGVDLGTLSWTAQSLSGNRTAFYVPQSSLPAAPLIPQFSSDVPDALSSIATPTHQTASSWGVNSFLFTASAGILPASSLAYIFDANQFAGADEFRAAVSGQLLVYALATPAAPITLSADDVLSLPGDCNVWADCGGISELTYRVDPNIHEAETQSEISDLTTKMLNAYPTESSSGSVASTSVGADGIPLKSLVVQITPVQATGTPSPENPLPISGWTGAQIEVAGGNLYDSTTTVVGFYINSSTGAAVQNANYARADYIPVFGGRQYVLAGGGFSGDNLGAWYDANKQYISGITNATLPAILTAPANARFARFTMGKNYVNDAVFQPGDTVDLSRKTFVEPSIIPVNWQTEAGTVYGGTLTDNGNGTWTLTVTHILADVLWGDVTGTVVGTTITRKQFYNAFSAPVVQSGAGCINSVGAPYLAASAADSVHYYVAGDGLRINLFLPNETPDTTRIQITGELVTPQTYTLTADDVLSLLGVTNVWADCGDVEAVFRCDPTLALDQLRSAILALGNNT